MQNSYFCKNSYVNVYELASKNSNISTQLLYGEKFSKKIKMPGLLKYADVTLKKGVFADDNQFYEWMSQISLNTYERLTVVIRLLDETATPRMTWTLTNAFPLKVTPTDMNSQSSEAGIETLVLAHEGMVQEVG